MEFGESGDQDFAMVGVGLKGIRVFRYRNKLLRSGLGCLIYAEGIYPWGQRTRHEGRVRHREGLGVPAFSVEQMISLDSGEGSRARNNGGRPAGLGESQACVGFKLGLRALLTQPGIGYLTKLVGFTLRASQSINSHSHCEVPKARRL